MGEDCWCGVMRQPHSPHSAVCVINAWVLRDTSQNDPFFGRVVSDIIDSVSPPAPLHDL
jgi:hypothetical protein